MSRARVLLADDHTLVLEGIKKLLEPHFDLVGTVEDGRALLESAQELKPDVILADISMPLLNGIDAARQLRKLLPEAKIVFLSMHADPMYVTEAFRAGGAGYLLKRSAASELVFAIEEVLKGRFYVTPAVAKDVIKDVFGEPEPSRREPPTKGPTLTPPPTRSAPARGRRQIHQGDRDDPRHLHQDGRVPQVAHHGGARPPHDGGAHQIRRRPRHRLPLTPSLA